MTTAIVTFGYPGAGKGTTLDIAEQHDIPTLTMGDLVRRNAKRAYSITGDANEFDTLDNEYVGQYATTMRELHGYDVMAHLTIDEIQSTPLQNEPVIVIDGMRGLPELEALSDTFESVLAVYIDASFETRLERLQERARDTTEASMTAEDLEERDEREGDWGLDELVDGEHFDARINNDGSLEEFRSQIHSLFETHIDTDVITTQ